jgi:AcrR family transcriptional regulator
MPRPRTISDEDILAVARVLFLTDGTGASTRVIAKEAGISEAILFQRFGTKERLFFAAMVPPPAKLDEIFNAVPGKGKVTENLQEILLRLLDYFRQVMPLFVTLVSHRSFKFQEFVKGHDMPVMMIGGRLAEYLKAEARLGRVRARHVSATTTMLLSTIHNHAVMESLGAADVGKAPQIVSETVKAIWNGLEPS